VVIVSALLPQVGRELRGRKWEYAALLLYALLLAILIPRHEPWFDEAQAWLLARDLSPVELYRTYIRYEGSPGLWHLLLLLPTKLGLPYATLNLIAGVLATLSASLILLSSRMPALIRFSLPFTYFFAYQYAVVARSYVLLTMLLLLLAVAYRRRYERPWPFALVLALLANATLHGLIIAFVMTVHFLFGALRRHGIPGGLTRHLPQLAVVALAGIVAAVQLIPPPDLGFAPGYVTDLATIGRVAGWRINGGFAGNAWATAAVVAVSLWWFFRKRVLGLYLMLVLPLLALFAVKYSNAWHDGIVLVVWVFALWLSFDSEAWRGPPARWDSWAVTAVAAGLVLVHVWWAGNAYRNDYRETYSAAGDVAAYIHERGYEDGTVFAMSFHSIAIQPYFDSNVFDNYVSTDNVSFLQWTVPGKFNEDLALVAADQPDLVVWGIKFPGQENLPQLPPNYRLVQVFDGHILWKAGRLERDAFAVFERVA
jgi:hypothetical protein